MGKSAFKIGVFAFFAALSLPVLAQPQEAAEHKEVATLRIEGGVIMLSSGGAFASATPGERLFENERLMVSNDSKAKVVWDDGCEQTYDRPGVYTIDRNCKAAAAADWRVTPPLAIAAVLIGGGVAAAIINDRGHKDPPPDPPASR